MASFPFGDNDDYCDSSTMALMRFRQGGFLSLQGDYPEEAEFLKRGQTGILLMAIEKKGLGTEDNPDVMPTGSALEIEPEMTRNDEIRNAAEILVREADVSC